MTRALRCVGLACLAGCAGHHAPAAFVHVLDHGPWTFTVTNVTFKEGAPPVREAAPDVSCAVETSDHTTAHLAKVTCFDEGNEQLPAGLYVVTDKGLWWFAASEASSWRSHLDPATMLLSSSGAPRTSSYVHRKLGESVDIRIVEEARGASRCASLTATMPGVEMGGAMELCLEPGRGVVSAGVIQTGRTRYEIRYTRR